MAYMKLVSCLLACLVFTDVGRAWEEVEDVPNPRNQQEWVVDLAGTLSGGDFTRIDDLCEQVHVDHGYQVTVVVIRTTGRKSVEQFATQLFNRWGVGDAVNNDGVLFLIAKDDRKMRIELGTGIDDRQNENIAKRILDQQVTPRFRQGNFGGGIYRGTSDIITKILTVPVGGAGNEVGAQAEGVLVPATAFNGKDNAAPAGDRKSAATRNRNSAPARNRVPVRQRDNSNPLLPWLFGGGAVGVGGVSIAAVRRWMRYRDRNCQRCNNVMVLLDESQEDQFLEKPEILEEELGSVDYDVWACLSCEDVVKLRYGAFFTKYSKCPDCRYQTKYQIKNTIRRATRHSGGLVEVQEQCENCKFYSNYQYRTPKLPKKSSSSSFGGGGSGRSSGGFGGGRSSGGGASGGW